MAYQWLQLVIFLRQPRLLIAVLYINTLKRLLDSINTSHWHNISIWFVCWILDDHRSTRNPLLLQTQSITHLWMAVLCLLARCRGFMLIMEIAVKSVEQCRLSCAWSFLSMSLLHYYWHAALFNVLKCLHLSGIGKCQMHCYILLGHAWDHNS